MTNVFSILILITIVLFISNSVTELSISSIKLSSKVSQNKKELLINKLTRNKKEIKWQISSQYFSH